MPYALRIMQKSELRLLPSRHLIIEVSSRQSRRLRVFYASQVNCVRGFY